MNCTVCGNPLLFDRVAFHCSCGAFVHAYCWDEHVLQAHRPAFEIGAVNLDGEFMARECGTEAPIAETQVSEEQISEAQASEEQISGDQVSEEQLPAQESPEEQTTPLLE